MRQIAGWGIVMAVAGGFVPNVLDARPSISDPTFLEDPTQVLSQRDADRLLTPSGITLQWLGWDDRGHVSIAPDEHGVWHVEGSQNGPDGGKLELEGTIREIGEGYFTLRGKIAISDAPDDGRECRANKTWHFAVTQNRRYYRLREFEWCDGLTDYVDIYF